MSNFLKSYAEEFSYQRLKNNKKLSKLMEKYQLPTEDILLSYKRELCLEIGFGNGKQLLNFAELYPEDFFIGSEVFTEGVFKLLSNIDKKSLDNIAVYTHDARQFLTEYTKIKLKKVFVLFPDPWHKSKHTKRRLITTDFFELVGSRMVKGGDLFIAVDNMHYLRSILYNFLSVTGWVWLADSPSDWLCAPSDWIQTKYEVQPGLRLKSTNHYLHFKKT